MPESQPRKHTQFNQTLKTIQDLKTELSKEIKVLMRTPTEVMMEFQNSKNQLESLLGQILKVEQIKQNIDYEKLKIKSKDWTTQAKNMKKLKT